MIEGEMNTNTDCSVRKVTNLLV